MRMQAVYRVGDMKSYIKWAQDCLGMKLLRYREVPEEKYSNAFLGYGPEETHFAMELTENFGVSSYDIGEGFGHFGVALPSAQAVFDTVDAIKAKGGKVTREAGAVKGGKTTIAFVQDPSGYSWELIGRENPEPPREPLAQVMLRVGDLDRSIKFYTEALGMRLLRTRENEQYKYTLAFLGYDDEVRLRKSTIFSTGAHRYFVKPCLVELKET
jgi:lactoylglutathione lyase